jgi:hypothetical protein
VSDAPAQNLAISALAWTSCAPSSSLAFNPIVVSGAGFLASGIDTMKLDDGTNAYPFPAGGGVTLAINSDAQMTLANAIDTPPAGVYTLYYSTDGGGTWTTTGLTVTIT